MENCSKLSNFHIRKNTVHTNNTSENFFNYMTMFSIHFFSPSTTRQHFMLLMRQLWFTYRRQVLVLCDFHCSTGLIKSMLSPISVEKLPFFRVNDLICTHNVWQIGSHVCWTIPYGGQQSVERAPSTKARKFFGA
jgi:hypothetical protein